MMSKLCAIDSKKMVLSTFAALLLTFALEKYCAESIPTIYEANIVAIFVSESELQLSGESLQAAVVLGVEDANKRYPHIRFNLKLKNDSKTCFHNYAGVLAAEEYYKSQVTAFVGPACSKALEPVSRMASYWNVPVYTAGGIDMLFSLKNIFSTLTRVSFSIDQVTKFILHILMEFQWRHIAIFVDESEASETILRRSLSEIIKQADYEMFPIYKEFNSSQKPNYKQMLQDANKTARVFIILACGGTVRSILLAGYDLGMENGEYAFLSIELLKNQLYSKQFNWYKPNDKRNKEARKMYESLLIISIRVPVREEYQLFIKDMKEIAKKKFSAILESSSINPIVGSFYDCVLLYAYSLNKTLSEGENPKNGRALARQIWNSTFTGGNKLRLTGDISINENGDREADYTLNDMDPETGVMIPIATFFGSRQIYEKLDDREIHWPGNVGPPLDMPVCGFTGDSPDCMPLAMMSALNIILPVLVAVSVVGSMVGMFAYRRIMQEAKLADYWWKIEWSELDFFDASHMGSSLSFTKSHNRSTPTNISGRGSTAPFVANGLFALYKGQKVFVKTLEMTKIQITRAVLMELKVDMLANHAIKIDWMFTCSIITDITEGMVFLHGSKIEYHGHLKSENCVIDGRFVVKLSNYSLRELKKQIPRPEQEDPWSLLWTAPEHLRRREPSLHGSKKGDVYSYAIILQEVITRSLPFEPKDRCGRSVRFLSAEDIIDRIRMGTTPPYRPELAHDECPPDMLDLIKKCWEENPDDRPSFPEIKQKMKKITKGMSSKNFLDNLLNRMEQYANDLESLVEEKTQSLYDEKKKTDELLYQMIPKFVAEELKKGCHVKPEYYESVTIFFSDIVGFTALSAESTPLQVVDFLNDLYSCFDAIIENFDVYKVETIGDAYMVASGLPVRNGNEHAREIARLALKLLSAITDFKIRHKPNRKLKIRIGLHSGPCVAGVVGLKMPRYCLFGDTVNTASRMESTSEAMKIHASHQTKMILDSFGTFIIVPRGEIEVKVK
ncbi:Atrial natriuretic peptide receptor 1 like protein [Argiope bruennichi]|uniref:Guanylate cyclase n=1 Tax=Argiope bruennichi TaxID=94029 RepID=A0A8T0FWN2_ARGBR|nr:Atrial natriuretic peptide receptor 1 like protein [Argiope bruennichi]